MLIFYLIKIKLFILNKIYLDEILWIFFFFFLKKIKDVKYFFFVCKNILMLEIIF